MKKVLEEHSHFLKREKRLTNLNTFENGQKWSKIPLSPCGYQLQRPENTIPQQVPKLCHNRKGNEERNVKIRCPNQENSEPKMKLTSCKKEFAVVIFKP